MHTRIEQPSFHPKYRPDIDGLRAIAVLSVVVYHAFPSLLTGGFIGVDVFFVISGFLISGIILKNLEHDNFSFASFYSRRVKRIFPALLLVLVATYALGWSVLLADEYTQLGKHIAGGSTFISNFILWRESGYFDNAAATKPLLHLWSLGVEEQFYVFWPLILWFSWKRKINLLTTIFVIAALSFTLNIIQTDENPTAAFYSPLTRFWELMFGAALAYVTFHERKSLASQSHRTECPSDFLIERFGISIDAAQWLRTCCATLGAVLIVIGLVVIKETHFPGAWALLPVTGTLLIIAAGSSAWLNRAILSNPVLVWFGLISYPLYLWHWPLMSFAQIVQGDPTPIMQGILVLVSIFLAWLTMKLVEKPLRFGEFGIAKTMALVVGMVVVGLGGYFTYNEDGLEFRAVVSGNNRFITDLASMKNTWDYFDVSSEYRVGICHMVPLEEMRMQTQNCIDKGRPLIFLWGDSYAASLYPGLLKLKTSNQNAFGIAQFTNGNAPPFFDVHKSTDDVNGLRQNLLRVNEEKLKIVEKIKPDLVMLSWMFNGANGADMSQSVTEIKSTVSRILAVSEGSKVIVVGPFPAWDGNLKDVFVKYAREHDGRLPPLYTDFGSLSEPRKWDLFFKEQFKMLGITYISSLDFLCHAESCLTRTGDDPKDLTAVDWGHLTPRGSEFLVDKISDSVLNEIGIKGVSRPH